MVPRPEGLYVVAMPTPAPRPAPRRRRSGTLALSVLALLGIVALAATGVVFVRRPVIDPGSLLSAYGIFFLSLLCHEVGHASACARYGARALVEHGAGGCQDRGDPTCVYHVSW